MGGLDPVERCLCGVEGLETDRRLVDFLDESVVLLVPRLVPPRLSVTVNLNGKLSAFVGSLVLGIFGAVKLAVAELGLWMTTVTPLV